jgi:hypothetical protein
MAPCGDETEQAPLLCYPGTNRIRAADKRGRPSLVGSQAQHQTSYELRSVPTMLPTLNIDMACTPKDLRNLASNPHSMDRPDSPQAAALSQTWPSPLPNPHASPRPALWLVLADETIPLHLLHSACSNDRHALGPGCPGGPQAPAPSHLGRQQLQRLQHHLLLAQPQHLRSPHCSLMLPGITCTRRLPVP